MKKELLLFFFTIFLFLYLEEIDIKLLIIFFILFYLYNEYILKRNGQNKNENKENEKKDGNKKKKEKKLIQYNDKLSSYFKKLKKYKKVDPKTYEEGMFYWKKFIKNLSNFDDGLYQMNQYFENTELYLKKSINIFQSLSISIPERSYIDGLNQGDFTSIKNTMIISNLIQKIYKEGYLLLFNLSLKLNKKWEENPHINNKEIVLDPISFNNLNNYDIYV